MLTAWMVVIKINGIKDRKWQTAAKGFLLLVYFPELYGMLLFYCLAFRLFYTYIWKNTVLGEQINYWNSWN